MCNISHIETKLAPAQPPAIVMKPPFNVDVGEDGVNRSATLLVGRHSDPTMLVIGFISLCNAAETRIHQLRKPI